MDGRGNVDLSALAPAQDPNAIAATGIVSFTAPAMNVVFGQVFAQTGFLLTPSFYVDWEGASLFVAFGWTPAGEAAAETIVGNAFNGAAQLSPSAAQFSGEFAEGVTAAFEGNAPAMTAAGASGYIGYEEFEDWGEGRSNEPSPPPPAYFAEK